MFEDKDRKLCIICSKGTLDMAYPGLVLANAALMEGIDVTMFFTFWGLQRLKKGGLEKGPLSKMHMFGLGKLMVKMKMKKQNVEFEEVYDLFAIRIIIDTKKKNEKADCWTAYSFVTEEYQTNPKPGLASLDAGR